jgi:hypothetical protein
LCAIIERCVEKSHAKTDNDEVWIVEDKIISLFSPLEIFLKVLVDSELIQYHNNNNNYYNLKEEGKSCLQELLDGKIEFMDHYQNIISSPFSSQSILSNQTSQLSLNRSLDNNKQHLQQLGFPEKAVSCILKLDCGYFVSDDNGLWIAVVKNSEEEEDDYYSTFMGIMKEENINVYHLKHRDCQSAT